MFDRDLSSPEADGGISEIHYTEDGPLHLWASPDSDGRWRARFWGTQLAGARCFKTKEEANSYLRRSFRDMFPAHACGVRCGTSEEVAQRCAAEEMNFWDYDPKV